MPCYKPIFLNETTKYKNGRRWKGGSMKVPCGRCIGCKLEYSRSWAMRCTHEASLHDDNCFLTLTFNNEHLPTNGSISRRDLQLFMKRLRKAIEPKEVKYYGCGEYGDNLNRPHYHVLLFGHDFADKVIHKFGTRKGIASTRTGEFDIFKSETLEKIWGKGFCIIGELTFESAAYVSRYTTKKITGPPAKDHYKGRTPEFALMSNGIGKGFVEKHFNDIYPKDFVTVNGKKCNPCRYYDNLLIHKDLDLYDELKSKRKEKTENIDENRLYQKEQHKQLLTKPLIRRFDNA